MHKVKKGLSPNVFANTFTSRNQLNYNLRHITCFKVPLVYSVYNAFLDPKVWEIGPEEVKQKESLIAFKDVIKIPPTKCPCRLCKDFLHGLGFLHSFA